MTYGLSIHCNSGIVLSADSFTNTRQNHGGADSTRMHRYVWPGNRFIAILSSGHPDVIAALNSQLNQDLNKGADKSLLTVTSLQAAADYIAETNTQLQKLFAERGPSIMSYETSYILAGQIGLQPTETMLIYAQGNYINESEYSPYLQIGDSKYGKPILDRVVKADLSLAMAARCAMVSMNSTMVIDQQTEKSIELLIYKKDSLNTSTHMVLQKDHPFANNMAVSWNHGLQQALTMLPKFAWENY
ncbi:MAG TPA: peptidase [Methylophilaceae bacterium]|nr:peptidase [Methylophilaceae bacterium]